MRDCPRRLSWDWNKTEVDCLSKLHKKIIQRYYSKRARNYDKQKIRTWKSELGIEAKILNEVISAVFQAKNELILEVGVGTGRMALPLMKETPSRIYRA